MNGERPGAVRQARPPALTVECGLDLQRDLDLLAEREAAAGDLDKREIDGIGRRMLTVTLRGLERDGIVSRTVFPVMPPRVDYALTSLGQTLMEAAGSLVTWAETHLEEIGSAREEYDARNAGSRPSSRPDRAGWAGPSGPERARAGLCGPERPKSRCGRLGPGSSVGTDDETYR